MRMSMIVAMDEEGYIGRGEGLPWRLASDMARFKQLTEGDGFNAVIMGRKTWDSLPEAYRPCLLYTSPSPRDVEESRMPSSA